MEMWIGGLLADVSPPEKPKFRAPLLLLHGPWSGSWCWQSWATHFCNLGWECWAINFRGRFEERPLRVLRQVNFAACVEDLSRAIRSAPFPPVVAGHSLGALVALKAAEEEKLSALVLLSSPAPKQLRAPLPKPVRLLRLKYALLIWLRRPFRLAKKDSHRFWFGAIAPAEQAKLCRRMVAESSYLIRDFFERDIEFRFDRVRCPILALGGSEDPLSPAADLRELARALRADCRVCPGRGHWLLGDAESEEIVRDVHRWVVQKLGEQILLAEL
jgi:pimeloyl-ACP methyl ester carboxylesterase